MAVVEGLRPGHRGDGLHSAKLANLHGLLQGLVGG